MGRLQSGVVTSYNYPFNYRNGSTCMYTIFLPERPVWSNQTICFQFHQFEVQTSKYCNSDNLQFPWNDLFPNTVNSFINYCGNGSWGYFSESLPISNIFSQQLCCKCLCYCFLFNIELAKPSMLLCNCLINLQKIIKK